MLQERLNLEWLVDGGWIVPAGRLALALLIIGLTFMAGRLLRGGLERIRGRTRLPPASVYIVEKLAGYGLIAAGLFVALSTLGVNLTSLAVFAGAVGVGVGLGLQGIVREFVSGLVVIFDQHINVGDFVELEGGLRGEIVEVGPRASRIRTNDALDIVLPNSQLIENRVINWTLRGETRRIHIPFSVAYGVDKAKVRDAVLAAAKALPFTEPDTETHRTQVWLVGFGDSALNFELVVWPTPEAARRAASMHAAYTWAIDDALRQADIEIPYPQVDLRIRSLFGQEGGAALEALKLSPQPDTAKRQVGSTPNDALRDAQLPSQVADPIGYKPVER